MDKLTPQQRSENMRRIRSKDMEPELEVRRLVHRLGYRFRLHDTNLPANPTSFSVPAEKLSKFTVAFGISIIPLHAKSLESQNQIFTTGSKL